MTDSYVGPNPLKRWPLASFYLLSLALASGVVIYFWAWMVEYANSTGVAFDYVGVLEQFSDRSFWKSGNLPVIIKASLEHPIILLIFLYALAPTIAALIVTAGQGSGAVQRWLARLKPWGGGVGIRAAGRAYLLITVTFLVAVVGFGIANLMVEGSEGFRAQAPSVGLTGLGTFLLLFLGGAFLDEGGTLEEMGWRGFAQPNLQDGGITPLKACILVGVLWGLWHVPRDLISLFSTPLPDYLIGFSLFMVKSVGMSVVIGYFFNCTGGSVIPAIAIHGLVNFMGGISYFPSLELGPWGDAWRAGFVSVWAVILVWKNGEGLASAPRQDSVSP